MVEVSSVHWKVTGLISSWAHTWVVDSIGEAADRSLSRSLSPSISGIIENMPSGKNKKTSLFIECTISFMQFSQDFDTLTLANNVE